ncbi:hypothetical protein TGAM01_v207113 [Trichoderma gamsii]|uniref:Uncharacterized protein n=1 Tax=Trichoderma gamsii TaxID=398673 RepID=A0A2P4ZIJ6_9HYPO|nr:hypothetical protein TGAM01_v207113 [Trichoderma gamsii]PON24102.1 hypothetical protein TGAM01_v207113 [Trichoderma gamsii]
MKGYRRYYTQVPSGRLDEGETTTSSADSYRNPAAWHTMVLNIWVILRQEAIETRAADIALPRAQPFIDPQLPFRALEIDLRYWHSSCLLLSRWASYVHVSKGTSSCEMPSQPF